MKGPKRLYLLVGVLAVLAVMRILYHPHPVSLGVPIVQQKTSKIEIAPPCPWREPESDMQAFFPGATDYQSETPRVLSGLFLEIARRLGRRPTAEELLLRLNQVHRGQQLLGYVLTQRVKGEFGAIEIVLALRQDGQIQGLRLQREREPEAISAVLQSSTWLSAFQGKSAASDWHFGQDIPAVPAEARASAQGVVEGVRTLLILFDISRAANPQHSHHSH
jgi:hypothetical protein